MIVIVISIFFNKKYRLHNSVSATTLYFTNIMYQRVYFLIDNEFKCRQIQCNVKVQNGTATCVMPIYVTCIRSCSSSTVPRILNQ